MNSLHARHESEAVKSICPLDGKAEKRETVEVKTTIDLPDPLFRRAKARASERGVSLKAFITSAVQQSLATPTRSWSALFASLPDVPGDTLEIVRARVAEADASDVASQSQANP